ncbi:MAG: SDR family NAD(P)-dependent oxidoreductase [Rhodospirillales bacterium]
MTGEPHSILITGASSGIGAALAAAYARPGVALHLGGRDRGRLAMAVDRCRVLGASAAGTIMDVTDREGMAGWIAESDRRRPLDLVIANAGISAGGDAGVATESSLTPEDASEVTRRVFATNIDGVANTVLPALELMRARPLPPARRLSRGWRGQIAIMSSLAAFRGMPGAPAYSASKAAEKAWGEALSARLAGDGIAVTVILPGFVMTPMTERNPFPMPMLMPAGEAARIIKRRLMRKPARLAFPFPMFACAWFLSLLPPVLVDPILAALPDKSAKG